MTARSAEEQWALLLAYRAYTIESGQAVSRTFAQKVAEPQPTADAVTTEARESAGSEVAVMAYPTVQSQHDASVRATSSSPGAVGGIRRVGPGGGYAGGRAAAGGELHRGLRGVALAERDLCVPFRNRGSGPHRCAVAAQIEHFAVTFSTEHRGVEESYQIR